MENRDEAYINKENTLAIKGVAVILMFIHHFFTFPDWIITDISYPYIEQFRYALKICVPIYAFITGYIYTKSGNNRKLKYSIKKITDLLLYYWFVYFVFLIINFIIGNKLSIIDIIKEIFLIDMPVMFFCWYIRFYCISILILPLLSKFKTKKIALDIIFLLVFPLIIINILFIIFKQNLQLQKVILELLYYFPCICIGVIFGKYMIFNKMEKKLKSNIFVIDIITSLYLTIIVFLIRSLIPAISFKFFNYNFLINLDIIYIPIFIYGLTYITQIIKGKSLLVRIGKYSLLMWLTHCIFFNTCKSFFQPILYIFKEPLIVLVWGLFLCYTMSKLFEKPINKLLQLKNRI